MPKPTPESFPLSPGSDRANASAREAARRDSLRFAARMERTRIGDERMNAPAGSSQRYELDAGWYPDALRCLRDINAEARDRGYPTVDEAAKVDAARLLLDMTGAPWEPAIYPSMDGEIAIYFKSPRATAALLILLGNSRQAACYWSTDTENSHKRYEDVSELPDEFLFAKMRTLIRPALLQTGPEFLRRALV